MILLWWRILLWMLTDQGLCIQRPCASEAPVHNPLRCRNFPDVLYQLFHAFFFKKTENKKQKSAIPCRFAQEWCVQWSLQINYSLLRPSPITVTQNTRLIRRLVSATGKEFNIYFWSSLTIRPKRQLFLQIGLQERGYWDLGYASPST
jgi:hypothetical protein